MREAKRLIILVLVKREQKHFLPQQQQTVCLAVYLQTIQLKVIDSATIMTQDIIVINYKHILL